MHPLDLVGLAIVVGGITGIARRLIDAATRSGKHKATAAELRATRDRARTLEAQLLMAHRQNEQLQQQLEWHTKMFETQDRLVRQLTDGSHTAQSRSERPDVSPSLIEVDRLTKT